MDPPAAQHPRRPSRRLADPVRSLLLDYLLLTRHLRSAARAGDLDRARWVLERRGQVLEALRHCPIDDRSRARVRSAVACAECCALRARDLLVAAADRLRGELAAIGEQRRRITAFRPTPTAPATGAWLERTS